MRVYARPGFVTTLTTDENIMFEQRYVGENDEQPEWVAVHIVRHAFVDKTIEVHA